MHIEKFTHLAVCNQLRHANRTIVNDSNKDIDLDKTEKFNYSLTPYITNIPPEKYYSMRAMIQKRELVHYLKRKSELYCYNRPDVKTLAGCIVTLPKEITDLHEEKRFFTSAAQFLSQRFNPENVVSITVHKDENALGQPHMHFYFIPACKIDHDKLMQKKKHCKKMENFKEKISANDVLTKRNLQTLHSDFQKYLNDNGFTCRILNNSGGDGKSISLSVSQLKEITRQTGIVIKKPITVNQFAQILQEHKNSRLVTKKVEQQIASLKKENAQLLEQICSLQNQLEIQQSQSWGANKEWDSNHGWNNTKDQEVIHTWEA